MARSLTILLVAIVSVAAIACTPLVAVTQPVIKLGLVAPFEGRDRGIGYEALYAAKLAIREHNASAKTGARVELLALDSGASADLIFRQARALAVDPDVRLVAIISPASIEPQVHAAYSSLAGPLVLVDPATSGPAPDPQFIERYRTMSGGATPGPLALKVYDALAPSLGPLSPASR